MGRYRGAFFAVFAKNHRNRLQSETGVRGSKIFCRGMNENLGQPKDLAERRRKVGKPRELSRDKGKFSQERRTFGLPCFHKTWCLFRNNEIRMRDAWVGKGSYEKQQCLVLFFSEELLRV